MKSQILRKLNHKNIPTFFESISTNESLFYVMSFIEGDNIEDQIFLRENKFNENESLHHSFTLVRSSRLSS